MRARSTVGIGLLSALALAPASPVAADGLDDALGPRELATGEARRADVSGAQAASLNPAGLPLTRDLTFEGSYGYRSFDGASLISASACDSTNAAPGCFYYRYAGGDTVDGRHQRAHVAGLTLARPLNARAMIGLGAKYINARGAAADGSEDITGFNWDAGLVIRLTDQFNLAATGYNLFGTENVTFARAVGGGASFRPSPALVAAFDARWDLSTDGPTGRYGGGLEYFVSTAGGQTGYPLRAGVVHDVATGTFITGGLGIATVKFALDIGVRKQVKDGDDLQLSASLRVFGPRQ
ncbi:MAG: hypothetical protein IPL61_17575 [Myxococcales bacterium]|nr:hypothetical protein [Myxococcales bacterium]